MKSYGWAAALFLSLASCGGSEEPAAPEGAAGASAAPDPSAHNGPNGGHVLMLGDQEAFLEVKTNHHVGTVTIWLYRDKTFEGTVPIDEEPMFNFVTDDGPMQLEGEEYDDSWVFFDEALKQEPRNARFRIKIKGKSFAPPFVHSHKKAPVTPETASEDE